MTEDQAVCEQNECCNECNTCDDDMSEEVINMVADVIDALSTVMDAAVQAIRPAALFNTSAWRKMLMATVAFHIREDAAIIKKLQDGDLITSLGAVQILCEETRLPPHLWEWDNFPGVSKAKSKEYIEISKSCILAKSNEVQKCCQPSTYSMHERESSAQEGPDLL